jgi:hypothetical protein
VYRKTALSVPAFNLKIFFNVLMLKADTIMAGMFQNQKSKITVLEHFFVQSELKNGHLVLEHTS